MSSLLESFLQVRKQFLAAPPVLVDFWFVDRQRQYAEYRARVGFPEQQDPLAVRAVEWYSHLATTEEEWQRAPAFCRVPGVYARLSNGTTRLLDDMGLVAVFEFYGEHV